MLNVIKGSAITLSAVVGSVIAAGSVGALFLVTNPQLTPEMLVEYGASRGGMTAAGVIAFGLVITAPLAEAQRLAGGGK